ncbi:MAG: hypothetical protein OEV34_07055 [Gammaproteobacteria bacterium]|jgi:hypothetical protein|nr:hypothetical protein [Gammaproteobacteria bacterium]
MKWKLSKLASVAEIIAAFGVILSLLFVGFQIQDGNRETRAATLQATLDSEMALQSEAMRYAGTWEKVVMGVHLADGEEKRRGILLFSMMMTLYQNQFYQFKSGYLDDPPATEDPLTWPFYEVWRGSKGATNRSPEFLEFLDRQRELDAVQ